MVSLALITALIAAPDSPPPDSPPPDSPPRGAKLTCPGEAELKSRKTSEATESWCELAGKRHGPRAAWYPDGQAWFIGNYLNNLRDGDWRFWYPSGKPQSRGLYTRDKRHGRSEHWHENGQLAAVGACRAGVEHGRWIKNYPNGKPELYVVFNAGKPGARAFYSRRGRVVELRDFVLEKVRGAGQARFDAALHRYGTTRLFEECSQ